MLIHASELLVQINAACGAEDIQKEEIPAIVVFIIASGCAGCSAVFSCTSGLPCECHHGLKTPSNLAQVYTQAELCNP